MADRTQLDRLRQGADIWNAWRDLEPAERVDLRGADLSGLELSQYNLSEADLSEADLTEAVLHEADLRNANLDKAILQSAALVEADLAGASMRDTNFESAALLDINLSNAVGIGANMRFCDLTGSLMDSANFCEADFSEATFRHANIVNCNLRRVDFTLTDLRLCSIHNTQLDHAVLDSCFVLGISTSELTLDGAIERNIIFSDLDEPTLSVDSLSLAEAYATLMKAPNGDIHPSPLDSGIVLIMGQFALDSLAVIDGLRAVLEEFGYVAAFYNYDKPPVSDTRRSLKILCSCARFIIVDISGSDCLPHELASVIQTNTMLPVQPIHWETQEQWGEFDSIEPCPWVLPTQSYERPEDLIEDMVDKVVLPAEEWLEGMLD